MSGLANIDENVRRFFKMTSTSTDIILDDVELDLKVKYLPRYSDNSACMADWHSGRP